MGLTQINTSDYITDTDPTPATTRTMSDWFTTEDRTGIGSDALGWMLAQGWKLDGTATDFDGNETHTMSRRIVDAEKMLKSMVDDYTKAYNEGRELNDSRYDEIVTLYSVMQSSSEVDWITREAGNATAEALILTLTDALTSDYNTYEDDTEDLLDDYGTNILAGINVRFDNLLTAAAQDLTNRGMYNSTIPASVDAGIETQRTYALNDANDKIAQTRVNQKNTLHSAKSTMRSKVIQATERVWTLIGSSADARLASRNAVMGALLTFMERRTDSYPDLAEIGKLATALGAGNAAGFQP